MEPLVAATSYGLKAIHSERHRTPPAGDSYGLTLLLFVSHDQAPSQTPVVFSSPPELRLVLALIARSLMMQ
jgi:hypothetical protein